MKTLIIRTIFLSMLSTSVHADEKSEARMNEIIASQSKAMALTIINNAWDAYKIGDYKLNTLLKADAVFLTGTAAEIQPVKKLNRKNFNVKSVVVVDIKKEYEKIKKLGLNSVFNIRKIL